MYTINNNDIDINGDSPSKLYKGKYITKYIGIPISEVKYNWKGKPELVILQGEMQYNNKVGNPIKLTDEYNWNRKIGGDLHG